MLSFLLSLGIVNFFFTFEPKIALTLFVSDKGTALLKVKGKLLYVLRFYLQIFKHDCKIART